MQKKRKGLAAALFALLFFVAGCTDEKAVYQYGMEQADKTATLSAIDETAVEADQALSEGLDDSFKSQKPDTQTAMLYIYVCGAVCCPGVYELKEGARVYEAIEAAGGFAEAADVQWLNQASLLSDGQKLYVYTEEETAQLTAANGVFSQSADSMDSFFSGLEETAAAGSADDRINLNTADKEALMTLPGIGETKADAIIQYRETQGGFTSIEEIKNISGVKEAVFSKIKDLIRV